MSAVTAGLEYLDDRHSLNGNISCFSPSAFEENKNPFSVNHRVDFIILH